MERLASILVGIGVSTGALWWLARSPASQVQLDLTSRRLRMVMGQYALRRLSEAPDDITAAKGSLAWGAKASAPTP